jgi:hypothetical protein
MFMRDKSAKGVVKNWQPVVTTNTLDPSQAGGSDVALRAQAGELTVDGLLSYADKAYATINQFVTFPDEAQRLKIDEINAERARLQAEADLQAYKNGAPVQAAAPDNTLAVAAIGGVVLLGVGLVFWLKKG